MFDKLQMILMMKTTVLNNRISPLNKITMSVLIDYPTWDTHKEIGKFEFSNSSIKVILSYLSSRQQYVQLSDKKSSYRPIYFGVP